MHPSDLPVRHAFAELPGARLHYVERGTGPLVLLLHGFPECWWSWRHQIGPVAAAGFRVVAPDLRGYNLSSTAGPFDLGALSGDVAALLDHLGADRARIVGHDWGGALAWHFASTRGPRCERLVVLNCPHPAVFARALRTSWRQRRRSWYLVAVQIPRLPEWLLTRRDDALVARVIRGAAVDRTHFGREELAPFREAVQRPGVARAMLGWYRAAARQRPRSRDVGPPVITVPSLLVWAMEDAALGYDDVVPGTERYVEDLRIERIEGCGHFVQSERPDEVNRLLTGFLGG
jgi:epoxide hydrolase 4